MSNHVILKLRLGQCFEHNWNWPLYEPWFAKACEKFGIRLLGQDSHEQPDFHFIDIRQGEDFPGPTILWDRHDTSKVTTWALQVGENNPNVIGYAIPTCAHEHEWSIANAVYGGMSPPKPYPEATKAVMVFNTMPYWLMQHMQSTHVLDIPPHFQRPIRASFGGSMHCAPNGGTPFPRAHRADMLRNWPAAGTAIVCHGLGETVFDGSDWYNNVTRYSKVVVSPWGVTEICARDYEALFAGCVIVKPWQSPMVTHFNPWIRDKNTVWCRPDFGDLPQAISAACDMFDRNHAELANTAIQAISAARMFPRLAKVFCQQCRRIFTAAHRGSNA